MYLKLLEPSQPSNQSLACNPSPLRCGGGLRNIRLNEIGPGMQRELITELYDKVRKNTVDKGFPGHSAHTIGQWKGLRGQSVCKCL
jgi:hypothetical protein